MDISLRNQPELIRAVFALDEGRVQRALIDLDQDPMPSDDEKMELKQQALRGAVYACRDLCVLESILLHLDECERRVSIESRDQHNLWSSLHYACTSNEHVASLERLLSFEPDALIRDTLWQTPAHVAASCGAHLCLKTLMDNNALPLVDMADNKGFTCLILASFRGHLNVVRVLLEEANASVNAHDRTRRSALHWAAVQGHCDVVDLLVEYEAEVEAKDADGNTPLALAAKQGHEKVVRALLSEDADLLEENLKGNTPVHLACLSGSLATLKAMLECEKDVIFTNNKGETPLHFLARCKPELDCVEHMKYLAVMALEFDDAINEKTETGLTPLHMSSIIGDVNRVEVLLALKADINAADKKGFTALHFAAGKGHLQVVECLVNAGSNVDVQTSKGQTALHLSELNGHVGVTDFLLQQVNERTVALKDSRGATALHFACVPSVSDEKSLVETLLSKGAEVCSRDKMGQMPLHWASFFNLESVVRLLISADSPMDKGDETGVTPLMAACCNANRVEFDAGIALLEQGAKTWMKNDQGYNALHYASYYGDGEALHHLLSHDEDLLNDSFSKSGIDPYMLAAFNGQKDIIVMLASKTNNHVSLARDRRGLTAFHWAAIGGQVACLRRLKAFEAYTEDACLVRSWTPLHLASMRGSAGAVACLLDLASNASSVLEAKDDSGKTAMHLAAEHGCPKVLEVLKARGASQIALDYRNRSPLTLAVVHGREECVQLLAHNFNYEDKEPNLAHIAALNGCDRALKLLLERSPHISPHNMKDKQGLTPLHWAVWNDQLACVKLLLAYPMQESDYTWPTTPLHLAASQESDKVHETLVSQMDAAHSDVEQKDHRGRTPLHVAAQSNSASNVRLLLARGADVNALDALNRTPLSLALLNEATDAAELLLSDGQCELSHVDFEGNTALHHACLSALDSLGKAMLTRLQRGSPLIAIQNDKGESPLHLAAPRGLWETTQLLLKLGASVDVQDNRCYTPILAFASNDSAALCLSAILNKYLLLDEENRRSSVSSMDRISLGLRKSCGFELLSPLKEDAVKDNVEGKDGDGDVKMTEDEEEDTDSDIVMINGN